ncbi:HAD hydrolase family protein [Actimicrobium sp. CCI2.3]|uniref:HAD hydrolase family protein n=1 Tax=Actimicrobium sp. CCI2.3 TaxID=3048616 RepID=UPI002AB35788|nr:HAD hydrolase family protein [Actimicrobium sp. CCI2.3]MDY7575095.1 HAD hydrolase family protein [Actimicrobium sp. CCI2.3]MEB0022564.1 HAD hydrolase family protein [Actimicrobium sp. CCI2.3]
MIKVLFADLDDSLFQSREKCPEGVLLQPAAFLKDGAAISYTTPSQRDFLELALTSMTVVPTTARNHNAFRRVDISFCSYAVLDYGGVILHPDGSVDAVWQQEMQDAMALSHAGLQRVMAVMNTYAVSCGYAATARIIEDFGTPFYVVMKDPDKRSDRLAHIEQQAVASWIATEGTDFTIHRNGNNLAVLPKALNKAHAVQRVAQWLRAQHGEIITFGLGDSRSDARFMAACDYAIVPSGTQLSHSTLGAL